MPAWKWLATIGLALTVMGAAVLAWHSLRGQAQRMRDLDAGPKPEAWWGFGLIAAGSALQIAGVLAS